METRETTLVRPEGFSIPAWLGGFLSFLLMGSVIYLALFATYPPIHDTMHKVRHSLAIVPCH